MAGAVTDRGRAYLISLQVVHDHHNISGSGERAFDHHLMYGIAGGLHIQCHNSPLTGSIAIGLDDDRSAMFFQVGSGLFSAGKNAMLGGRDTGRGHQFLRESFAAFERGPCRAWPEDAQTSLAEYISNAVH